MVRFAAYAMIALGLLHMVVLGSDLPSEIPRWADLNLWTFDHWQAVRLQDTDLALSNAVFWGTVGSFAVPMILFGALLLVAVSCGWRVPPAFGWAWLAWSLVCSFIMPPSGFPVAAVVMAVLTIGLHRQSAHRVR